MSYICRSIVFLALAVAPVVAQDPVPGWDNLDTSELSTVYVLDDMDAETTGTLIRLEPNSLTLLVDGAERRYSLSQVKRIQRRGDSLKNGVFIGAVVGAVMGGLAAGVSDSLSSEHDLSESVAYVLVSTGVYAAIGAGIDALITGRTTLYEAPTGSATSVGRPPGTLQIPPGKAIASFGFTW